MRPVAIALASALAFTAPASLAVAQTAVTLSGVALDAEDDNRFFTRIGGTVRDTVTYDGLVPGQPYTVVAQLHSKTTDALIDEPASTTFTPDAASGTVSVELPVPPNRTEFNIDYVVVLSLHEGEVDAANADAATALARLDDTSNPDQTIQSHAIQAISVTAGDAADGDMKLPPEGGTIKATVEFINLVEGYHYTIWGQLLTPSGQTRGIYASIPEYVPDTKNGTVELEFEVPEGLDGIQLVPTVGLYHQNRVELNADGSLSWLPDAPVPVMIAADLSVDAPEQTVDIGVPFEQQM